MNPPQAADSAAAYPYVAGQPCPICGVSLLTNDKKQIYCATDGVYPEPKQMNAVERAHEERRLRLAQLRPLDS